MKTRLRSTRGGMLRSLRAQAEDGFTCKHCGYFVSSASHLSGVDSRNHCPYCLWSRHLDLYRAGDRLCACKAPMRPVGLTHKRTLKKYAGSGLGELMLVHLCTECSSLSINRLAADDRVEAILDVFERSLRLEAAICAGIRAGQIELLEAGSRDRVLAQLVGKVSI